MAGQAPRNICVYLYLISSSVKIIAEQATIISNNMEGVRGMQDFTIQKKRATWQNGSCLFLILLLATGFFIPESGVANDLNECMTAMMLEASDSTTKGELRLDCEKQLKEGTFVVQEQEESAVEQRMKEDKENVLKPFTLMAHKPNYILLGTYNSAGYNAKPYQEQYNDSALGVDDIEAQFQVSIKAPLAVNIFNTFDIYGAYTNHSFWQVYNNNSAPFRETNHEPEGWIQFSPKWELWGFRNSANSFGIVHQSNGRGGTLSRSWNRLFANFIINKENFAMSFKPWYRIQEDHEDDDNPDITDYLGHYELTAAYKWNEHVFSIMSRNNLESGFEKGAVELTWSFPLWNYPYLNGYVQYFTGYGDSLIDYNSYVNKIGIGIAISDFL